jgi:hypothetical protein
MFSSSLDNRRGAPTAIHYATMITEHATELPGFKEATQFHARSECGCGMGVRRGKIACDWLI